MTVQIRSYVEGKTEQTVLARLQRLPSMPELIINGPPHKGKGKYAIKKTLSLLGPELGGPFRCLVMLDLDYGDKPEDLVEEFQVLLNSEEAEKRGVTCSFKQMGYNNVYAHESSNPMTKIVLHFAEERRHGFTHFFNCTTDDYLLRLLLCPNSIEKVIDGVKTRGINRNPPLNWDYATNDEAIIEIAGRVIDNLQDKRLPDHIEAKAYLDVYALIVREKSTEELDKNFVERMLGWANEADLQSTFQSLIAAIDFLRK